MLRLVASAVVAVVATMANAGEFLRADAPDWVERLDLPTADPAQLPLAADGVYYLLIDRQVAWQGDNQLIHARHAMQVLNRSGLEYTATVLREFDPAFDTMTLTDLDVIRDGKRINLRDTVSPRVFQRETDLESGIIDGTHTMHIDMPDIRVGDIVDIGVLWDQAPRVPGGSFADSYQLGYGVPMQQFRMRVDWPSERAIQLRENLMGIRARVEDRGAVRRYVWEQKAPQVFEREDNTPREYSPYPEVAYSAYADWAEVASGMAEYYNADYPLSPAWEARVAQMMQDNPTAEGRIIAALRAVQEDIRYVGIEIGAGGYYARTPQSVAQNGFGDCKDKSLLLKTVLGRMGIAADVALANLDNGHDIDQRLPGPQHFNHMIAGAHLNGRTYWMDPTGSYEGGTLEVATEPDYGFVLPLVPNDAQLTRITPAPVTGFDTAVTERFNFSWLGLFLNVETEYLGDSANWMRAKWAREPARDIQKGYLEYYASRYPGMRVRAPMTLADDAELNRIILSEHYFLPPNALRQEELYSDFPFVSENHVRNFPKVLIGPRVAPLAVDHSVRRSHAVEVRNAPINFNPPEDVTLDNPAFKYRFSGKATDEGQMTMQWSYESRARSVPPEAVKQVLRDVRKAEDQRYWTWDLNPDEETSN